MTEATTRDTSPDPSQDSGDDALSVTAALAAAVAAVGGDERAGQQQMAQAVADTFSNGTPLLVQAGTGTGKSLAYLVPAILHAVAPGNGPVIIATATLALQRQLVDRDLPRLADALEPLLSRRPTFAVLKGRHNYVCLDKLHRDVPEDDSEMDLFAEPNSRLGKQAKALRVWADKTDTGDRDDYREDLPVQLWRSISVQRRECVGPTKCQYGFDCFVEKARELTRTADIIVTNHAMLAIHVVEQIPVLPDHDAIIIDEAHELVDRATSTAAAELNAAAIERAATRARRFIDVDIADRLTAAGQRLTDALDAFNLGEDQTQILEEIEGPLFLALTNVRDACHAVASQFSGERGVDAADLDEAAAKQRARGAVDEVHDIAGGFLSRTGNDVVWLSLPARRTASLHIAPMSVAELLSEHLIDVTPVVLTSATLRIGGSFGPLATSIGLTVGADQSHRELDVGTPFDHGKQGILYCAAHLPPPGIDGLPSAALLELTELLIAAGGRTLALFSSWRAVERAQEYVKAQLAQRGLSDSLPVIVQSRGDSVGDLIDRFAAEPATSLFGTLSLWQGVDVPGDACTLVVIDRIPFPRPDEPLTSARSAKADEQGRGGFMTVSIPRAALLLAQGAGRLIRSMDDRGVIAVMDSRLANARYGSYLRSSLPPFWWTTDAEQVRQSLERLNSDLDS